MKWVMNNLKNLWINKNVRKPFPNYKSRNTCMNQIYIKYSYKRSKQSINLNTFSVISFKICIVHVLLKGYAYHQNRDHFG